MARDFTIIPHFLTIIQDDCSPIPRSLTMMGEALSLAYDLIEHPALLDRDDRKDLFLEAMQRPEFYKRFNRTVIERTIAESAHYGKVKFGDTFLILASKGIEIVLQELLFVIEIGNKAYENKTNDHQDPSFQISYRYFQLTSEGKITAAILGLIDACQTLILEIRKKQFEIKLTSISSSKEKRLFLLRKMADIQQQKATLSESVFKGLEEFIQIELVFLEKSTDQTDDLSDLRLIVKNFFSEQKAKISNDILLKSLVNSELDAFMTQLKDLVLDIFSFHDISGKEPEKVYHSFFLGILNGLKPQYDIKSNKEAGLGRFDILLVPQLLYHRGIIFEIKKSDTNQPDQIKKMLSNALQQIDSNQYYTELQSKGIKEYIAIAAVFEGKKLHLDYCIKQIPN